MAFILCLRIKDSLLNIIMLNSAYCKCQKQEHQDLWCLCKSGRAWNLLSIESGVGEKSFSVNFCRSLIKIVFLMLLEPDIYHEN